MIIPGDVPDLVVGEVEPLEGGVPPEGAEGDVADLVVGEVEEGEARQAVHDEAHVRHVVQLVVRQVQLLNLQYIEVVVLHEQSAYQLDSPIRMQAKELHYHCKIAGNNDLVRSDRP